MSADLPAIVDRFSNSRVLLVGDFMLDRYVFGDAERVSPEAPVPVLRVIERQDCVGGAGSVALNVRALGASVQCFGLVGQDRFGDRIIEALHDAGVNASTMRRVADRPTITKTRLIGLAEHRHRQQLLRVDDEIVAPPTSADAEALLASFTAALENADVVCLEDYAKGLLTDEFCAALINAARHRNRPVLIDPARNGGWARYRGATFMTPNRAELELGVGRRLADRDIRDAAFEVVSRLELQRLVVTLGRDGALLVRCDGSHETCPTVPRAVYDNTGAGDAVLAMMAVSLAAGATDSQAVALANVAGGLEVEKFGCVPITRDEVQRELLHGASRGRGKIRSLDDLLAELTARRQRGETVVFANGCFDLLHPGHAELLEQARRLGSMLVVGLNSDASVRTLEKGADRPVRRQDVRARMLASLESVDYVVFFDEPTPQRLIERIIPNVLVKGSDWAGKPVAGRDFVEAHGGRVELIELVEGFSTTDELERIRSTAGSPIGRK